MLEAMKKDMNNCAEVVGSIKINDQDIRVYTFEDLKLTNVWFDCKDLHRVILNSIRNTIDGKLCDAIDVRIGGLKRRKVCVSACGLYNTLYDSGLILKDRNIWCRVISDLKKIGVTV